MAAATDLYSQRIRAHENPGDIRRRQLGVKAATAVGQGYLTCVNAGFVDLPSGANAALPSNGIAMDNVDNSAGANGDLTVPTENGCIDTLNSGANPCGVADLGKKVYAEDFQTIGNSAAAGVWVGTLEEFNPAGGAPGRPCRVRVELSKF